VATRIVVLLGLLILLMPGLAAALEGGDQAAEREAWINYLETVAAHHQSLGLPPEVAAGYGLSIEREARHLESVGRGLHGRAHYLAPEAAVAWRTLRNRARSDGIELYLVSSFRSLNDQSRLLRQRLDEGRELGRVIRGTALPGYSEHHTGCAVDLATPDEPVVSQRFRDSDTYAWLQENAGDTGFIESYPASNDSGLIPEPWHWYFEGCER